MVNPISETLSKPKSEADTQSPSRFPLYLTLTGAWIFLAFHRELLFHAFRRQYEERTIYLIFADQAGFTHALLFAMAAVTAFTARTSASRLLIGAVGIITLGLTIALARVGYPFNQPDTFQSMAIRSLVYLWFIQLAVSRQWIEVHKERTTRPWTIADALLLTLVAAVFMAAIRGELNYFRRVTTIDLMYIRDDFASLLQLALEATVESAIGLLSLRCLQRRLTLAISLPIIFCAAIVGSFLSSMSYKLYRLYQFTEPTQIRTIQDTFQTHLPILLAFTIWLCFFGLVLCLSGVLSAKRR